jgi:hypothetical protein
MTKTKEKSLYLVARSVTTGSQYGDKPAVYAPNLQYPDGFFPVAGFPDEESAKKERDRLERLARETTLIGPFLFSLPPEVVETLKAAIAAAGLPPLDLKSIGPAKLPKREGGGTTFTNESFKYREKFEGLLKRWWAAVAPTITPEANLKLWDALFPEESAALYTVRQIPWGKE